MKLEAKRVADNVTTKAEAVRLAAEQAAGLGKSFAQHAMLMYAASAVIQAGREHASEVEQAIVVAGLDMARKHLNAAVEAHEEHGSCRA